MWTVKAKCLAMIDGIGMSLVGGKNRSRLRMAEYQEVVVNKRQMQKLEINAGRQQLEDIPEPAAGVMRMSADNGNQADQQHELADPGMAEKDCSVLDMP